MRRRLKWAAIVLVVLFLAAQLVRPGRANPPIDPSHTIQAQLGAANGAVAVLDRSCNDCHSNRPVSGWYTQVAPLSWVMAYSVREGRRALNFSEWAAYPVDRQRQLLGSSCSAVTLGKMPGAYTVFRPGAKVSASDIQTICAAAGAP